MGNGLILRLLLLSAPPGRPRRAAAVVVVVVVAAAAAVPSPFPGLQLLNGNIRKSAQNYIQRRTFLLLPFGSSLTVWENMVIEI